MISEELAKELEALVCRRIELLLERTSGITLQELEDMPPRALFNLWQHHMEMARSCDTYRELLWKTDEFSGRRRCVHCNRAEPNHETDCPVAAVR
jgi:hypothetical protein